MDRLYSPQSSTDTSTLFQLKHLIHRTSFGKEPKNNMKATEDFLETILIAHITAAAKYLQKISSSDALNFRDLAKRLVSKFIWISIPSAEIEDPSPSSPCEVDSVNSYAVDLLTMGLIWYGFRDSVREGDGDRIIRYWKFLLPIFRQEKHYNYANEAFLLIVQTLLLSPRQICDIKWNRAVDTTGRIGKNIPVDLHMEHLNRRLKMMIRNLGANLSPTTVKRASKALSVVDGVRLRFLKDQNCKARNKDYHTKKSIQKDLSMIEQQLITDNVFVQVENQNYKIFPHHKPLLQSIKWENISKWLKDKIINYNTYS